MSNQLVGATSLLCRVSKPLINIWDNLYSKPDDHAPLYSGAFPDICMNEQIIFYDRYETEIILSSLCKRLSLVIR